MQEQKGCWLLHGFWLRPELQEQAVVAGVERGSQMLVQQVVLQVVLHVAGTGNFGDGGPQMEYWVERGPQM